MRFSSLFWWNPILSFKSKRVLNETLLVCTLWRTESLSRLFLLLLNCTSSFGRFDEQKKQSGSSASRRVVRVCVSTRSLFSLSLFSSSFKVLTHFLGSQKSRHFLGFPSLSLGVIIQSRLLHPFFFHPFVIKGLLYSSEWGVETY